ncbi:MAG: cytochrome c biogenesis protein ResB [Verrucomicrobiota bacterium]
MKLAMVGLLTIALACAIATICESKFNAQVARTWFYNAPWFLLWLGFFCANLIFATLARWPWQRRHWGFVATHFGIVILLAGAMIGQKFGSDISLRLHTSVPFHETQMVFAKYDSVVVNRSGTPSGYQLSLSVNGAKPKVTIELPPLRSESFDLFSVLGKAISLQGDSTKIFIKGYWPDFVMKEGGPESRSNEPNNPAILALLSGSAESPDAAAVQELGFQIRLVQFNVPMDEGTNAPSDFRSTVRFTDPVTHETLDAVISMNHPASFPSGFWQTALGRNYKFFQAQWNPNDLGETTLQATRDPGWPLKWIGSLLLCVGIAAMFYLK